MSTRGRCPYCGSPATVVCDCQWSMGRYADSPRIRLYPDDKTAPEGWDDPAPYGNGDRMDDVEAGLVHGDGGEATYLNDGERGEMSPTRVPYVESGAFGYTSDPRRLVGVRQFVSDAVRDGWESSPTYPGGEPQERAATLSRDGFKIMALARDATADTSLIPPRTLHQASVHIWGPDGLAITPPEFYDFAALRAGLRRCEYCGADDVDTQRVGFAGRCCAACLPRQRKMQEYPGWCD